MNTWVVASSVVVDPPCVVAPSVVASWVVASSVEVDPPCVVASSVVILWDVDGLGAFVVGSSGHKSQVTGHLCCTFSLLHLFLFFVQKFPASSSQT